jgi:hypothetical protein
VKAHTESDYQNTELLFQQQQAVRSQSNVAYSIDQERESCFDAQYQMEMQRPFGQMFGADREASTFMPNGIANHAPSEEFGDIAVQLGSYLPEAYLTREHMYTSEDAEVLRSFVDNFGERYVPQMLRFV